jgi:ArsR family transcriptional regulator
MSAKDPRFATLEQVFRALADPTRLRILALLAGGEICVCHIHDSLGIPQPTASRHLAYLRRHGIVQTRKEGLWVHYSLARLNDPVMRVLMDSVTHCLGHCDAIANDQKRLAVNTGCCSPALLNSGQECCCESATVGRDGRAAQRPHASKARQRKM